MEKSQRRVLAVFDATYHQWGSLHLPGNVHASTTEAMRAARVIAQERLLQARTAYVEGDLDTAMYEVTLAIGQLTIGWERWRTNGILRVLRVLRDADLGIAPSKPGASMAGRDLSGANLEGADFTGADLHESTFGQELAFATFSNANLLYTSFYGANLEGADFTGARGGQTRFFGANLSGADFTGADLGCSDFTNATLDFSDFTGADLRGVIGIPLDVVGAKFDGAQFGPHPAIPEE